MKVVLISKSEKANLGFRPTGIRCIQVKDKVSVVNAWDSVMSSREVGLVLIDSFVNELIHDRVSEHEKKLKFPLLLVIPGDEKDRMKGDNLTEIIKETIGIKV